MPLEWLCAAVGIGLALRIVGRGPARSGGLLLTMAIGGAAVTVALAQKRPPSLPAPIKPGGETFVTSNTCRSCHPSQYESWHRSYHRTMTQQADTANVASVHLRQGGRLRVETLGRSVELFGRGPQLWARLPDPEITSAVSPHAFASSFGSAPSRDVQVQLVTGSHRHQAFWVAGARPGELRAVPAVYLVAEQRLIPRRDAFLNPPQAPEHAVRWNSNCVQCHVVAGRPGHEPQTDTFASSAAELGIACEACHGEGAEHVRAMQNPVTRYLAHEGERKSLAITNPQRLPSVRASEVCARCHSYFFPKHELEWWQDGFSRSYRPGDDLSRSQLLLSPEALSQPGAPRLGASAESLFYRDGTIRIGGREHNGLVRSPCFERGTGARQLSCLSCHSAHASDPDDQLAAGKDGNAACAPCHAQKVTNVSQHSRHAEGSPGSLCYNCHMPHTSYALLGAIRSHRIDSPSFDERTSDRPNACSLCHLEKSESWAAAATSRWYGDKPAFRLERRPGLERSDLPAGAVFALSGDAAVRAVTAAALARRESSAPSDSLRAQLLAELANDDYAAVRFIAERSGSQLPGAAGPPPLAAEVVKRLKTLRDTRPVTIAE